ncbi:MAG: peroxide stress protein YaaA [Clostridium sp.]
MSIIISPAKKMNMNNDDILSTSTPCYLEKSSQLMDILKSYSYEELKNLLCCNDSISSLNYDRYKSMDLTKALTPAILAYDGIQYSSMSPSTFTNSEFDYINNNLFILSGFYGVLRGFDGIVPYRLEMQAKLKTNSFSGLYNFWGDSIYSTLKSQNKTILNLASKEYSKCVEKYLSKDDEYITCVFGKLVNDKVKVTSTESKMARGLMTRFMATNNITNINDIKNFSDMSFRFSEELSSHNTFVFIK